MTVCWSATPGAGRASRPQHFFGVAQGESSRRSACTLRRWRSPVRPGDRVAAARSPDGGNVHHELPRGPRLVSGTPLVAFRRSPVLRPLGGHQGTRGPCRDALGCRGGPGARSCGTRRRSRARAGLAMGDRRSISHRRRCARGRSPAGRAARHADTEPLVPRVPALEALGLLPIALLALNAAMPYVAFSYPVGQTLMNLLIALVVHRLIVFPDSPAGRFLNHPALVGFGAMSYSLYLWQQPFLNRASVRQLPRFPMNIALALAAALLSYQSRRAARTPARGPATDTADWSRMSSRRPAFTEPCRSLLTPPLTRQRNGACCAAASGARRRVCGRPIPGAERRRAVRHRLHHPPPRPAAVRRWATAAALASAHLVMTNAGLRTIFVREVARRAGARRESCWRRSWRCGSRWPVASAAASALAIRCCFAIRPSSSPAPPWVASGSSSR